VVTSVILPIELHERAKSAATRLNWTLGEVLRVALEGWLDESGVA